MIRFVLLAATTLSSASPLLAQSKAADPAPQPTTSEAPENSAGLGVPDYGEVVITARRRRETAQEAPLAVSGTFTSITAWRFWDWDPANDRDYTGLDIVSKSQNPSQ